MTDELSLGYLRRADLEERARRLKRPQVNQASLIMGTQFCVCIRDIGLGAPRRGVAVLDATVAVC